MIGETIRELRRRRGISQEILAQATGVSVQAVSKWETSSSLPDILMMPRIAKFFGVRIDDLFYGLPEEKEAKLDIPDGVYDDGKLRIVQFLGAKPLYAEEWLRDKPIRLDISEDKYKNNKFCFEIWGGAEIEGGIGGGVNAGDGVNCGNVSGGVNAGDGVNCGNVSGGVRAGDGVNCGNISGGVIAGDGVNCGNISDGVSAGDSVSCGDISGSVDAGEIHCETIKDAESVKCDTLYINGDIKCGNLKAGEIKRGFDD